VAEVASASDLHGCQTLRAFVASLTSGDVVAELRQGLIGEGMEIPGPRGPVKLIYADYTASGRALRQVEDFVQERVLPFYSNSHTEASYCGAYVNRLRSAARAEIARICEADDDHAVIFTGSGATSAVNRLVHLLLGAPADRTSTAPALVLQGPYEHHSNILPWRESGAEVLELPEACEGGVDMAALEAALTAPSAQGRRVIGAFSAASNVTGILTDVAAVTAMLKRHGGLSVWDYAGGGPYLPISMKAGGGVDAVVLSPHKFVGGPGASGLLIVRRNAVVAATPSLPGGGTVAFVSPWSHRYNDDIVAREEAGTPNIVGDIRAALVLLVKEAVGCETIKRRCKMLRERALAKWRDAPNLQVLGVCAEASLPIFSFKVTDADGGAVHHQLVTRILSDYYGVQARGGCACAGPYAHRLLGISEESSTAIAAALDDGDELGKPGWTRLNLSYLMDDAKADLVIDAVLEVSRQAAQLREAYVVDEATARFSARGHAE
jgi:selenocysteine lyase/cysteine desulfurase